MRSFVLFIALFTGTALSAQNAYLTNGFVPRYWKANTDYVINVRVRNSNSTTPLLSFRVDWNWNNGPVQMGNLQSTTGIFPGQYWAYPHPIPFKQTENVGRNCHRMPYFLEHLHGYRLVDRIILDQQDLETLT